GEVGNGTPERDEGFTVEDAEADGVVDCPGECVGGERTAPISRAEQSEYGNGVEAPTIRGQVELATLDLDRHILHALTILPWSRLPNGSRLSCGRVARRRKGGGRQFRAPSGAQHSASLKAITARQLPALVRLLRLIATGGD